MKTENAEDLFTRFLTERQVDARQEKHDELMNLDETHFAIEVASWRRDKEWYHMNDVDKSWEYSCHLAEMKHMEDEDMVRGSMWYVCECGLTLISTPDMENRKKNLGKLFSQWLQG